MNESAIPASMPAAKRGPGRPFTKGAIPNPSGTTESKLKSKLRAHVTASLNHEPNDLETIAIDQIVEQLYRARRAKDHAESARCSRTAAQWLKDLQARAKPKPERLPSLQELLSDDYAND